MSLADVTNSGAIPLLEKTLAFTEARNRVLAENIANIDTPGYRTKQLDPTAFQRALAKAAAARKTNPTHKLELPASTQFHVDDATGSLVVTPSEEPPENLLFQDGTNARIEQQMAMLAENTLMHRTTSELLRGKLEALAKAIRGRTA